MSQLRAKQKSPTALEVGQTGSTAWGATYDLGAIAFGDQSESLLPKPESNTAIENDRHKSGVNRHVPGQQSHRSRSR